MSKLDKYLTEIQERGSADIHEEIIKWFIKI